MGWRGGCLAAELVRSTVCYYCLAGGSDLVLFARRSRQVWGFRAGAGSRSSLPSRPSRCVLQVVPSRCPFPSPAGTPFHAVCALRGLGLVVLRVRAACPLGVAALVLPRRTRLFPPPRLVRLACTLCAFLAQGAGRAVPGGSGPSAFPAPVPCSA